MCCMCLSLANEYSTVSEIGVIHEHFVIYFVSNLHVKNHKQTDRHRILFLKQSVRLWEDEDESAMFLSFMRYAMPVCFDCVLSTYCTTLTPLYIVIMFVS